MRLLKDIRVGWNTKHIKVGDRGGVGAQAMGCLKTDWTPCSTGREIYCTGFVQTYAASYADGSGISYGRYDNLNRSAGAFIFNVPACYALAPPYSHR